MSETQTVSGKKSASKQCVKRSQIAGWRSSKNLDISSERIVMILDRSGSISGTPW